MRESDPRRSPSFRLTMKTTASRRCSRRYSLASRADASDLGINRLEQFLFTSAETPNPLLDWLLVRTALRRELNIAAAALVAGVLLHFLRYIADGTVIAGHADAPFFLISTCLWCFSAASRASRCIAENLMA